MLPPYLLETRECKTQVGGGYRIMVLAFFIIPIGASGLGRGVIKFILCLTIHKLSFEQSQHLS